MQIIKWDKKLETGIELLDKQHKKIIEAANSFFISQKCKDNLENTNKCLNFLEQYVLYHFQAEEAFQVECNYESYREHQAKHNILSTELKFLAVKLRSSEFSSEHEQEFYEFLNTWIFGHILTEDRKFAIFYKESH